MKGDWEQRSPRVLLVVIDIKTMNNLHKKKRKKRDVLNSLFSKAKDESNDLHHLPQPEGERPTEGRAAHYRLHPTVLGLYDIFLLYSSSSESFLCLTNIELYSVKNEEINNNNNNNKKKKKKKKVHVDTFRWAGHH
eukprot:gene1458-847_t